MGQMSAGLLPEDAVEFGRTHETAKPLERPRDSDCRVDLNEDALGSVDVDLEATGLVERRVEQGQEALRIRTDRVSLLGLLNEDGSSVKFAPDV